MNPENRARLVAITGGSGAGKTWLADRLQRLFGAQAGRIMQDSFYRDRSHLRPEERSRINFDHPDALDWACFRETLEAMTEGRAVRVPVYDFATHCRLDGAEPFAPRPIVIVEGLWVLHRPEIRRLFSLGIFLHCPEGERLRRRVARDTAERGRTASSVHEQFRDTVAPMHRLFVDPQARHADLVLPFPHQDISSLHAALWRLLPGERVRLNRSRADFRSELQSLLQSAA
jgi:uridine kinase